MRNGGRPGNEFATTEKIRRRVPRPIDDEPTAVWPEMRVVRHIDTAASEQAGDWHNFLDNLGRRNYGKGQARALGSMAVVFLPAREMGRMLQEKYPRAYGGRDTTVDIQRKVATSIKQYFRSEFGSSYDAGSTEHEARAFAANLATTNFRFSNELEPSWRTPQTAPALPALPGRGSAARNRSGRAADSQDDSTPRFGDGMFTVSGIKLYGKDGYGLNLSQNRQLYDERDLFIKFLRSGEGLNISNVNKGWEPHATVFNFEQHIASAELIHDVSVPDTIGLEHPRPLVV